MLLELICKISYRLRRGKVILHIGRKYLIKEIAALSLKPSQHARDCGVIRSRCDEIKKVLSIKIEMKYSSNKFKSTEAFKQNQGRCSMRECSAQLKLLRKSMEKKLKDSEFEMH